MSVADDEVVAAVAPVIREDDEPVADADPADVANETDAPDAADAGDAEIADEDVDPADD